MLAVTDLSYAYPGRDPLFAGWAADFPAGSITAITGPSGRGKSTLLYLLGLMLQPTAGSITVHGEAVNDLSDAERSRLRAFQFGFVFQDAALDSTRSVLDNVIETALYRNEDQAAARERGSALLERFGVNVPTDARPGQVSGGQAQRIALCRALLNDPSIVLADEPTGNLDPESSMVVLHALRDHAEAGNTVVVVTHERAVADACHREIVLA